MYFVQTSLLVLARVSQKESPAKSKKKWTSDGGSVQQGRNFFVAYIKK